MPSWPRSSLDDREKNSVAETIVQPENGKKMLGKNIFLPFHFLAMVGRHCQMIWLLVPLRPFENPDLQV